MPEPAKTHSSAAERHFLFKQHLNCKTTSANVGFEKHAKLSPGICVRSSALRPSINGMKSKVNQVIWPSGKKRQRQGPCHRDDTAISSCSYITLCKFCYVLGRGRFFLQIWKVFNPIGIKSSLRGGGVHSTQNQVFLELLKFSQKFAIFCTCVTQVRSNTTKRCLIVRFSPKRVNSDQKNKIKHHLAFLETNIFPVLKHSDCPRPV